MIGKIINDIKIADDKKALLFKTEQGDFIIRVDGDCCSNTWIEHVELPLKFPAKIISVDNLDMPEKESKEEEWGTVIQYYGCKISTDKGDMIIDYRNESNGYYGGSLVFPDDGYYYGGVSGQNESTNNWIDIK